MEAILTQECVPAAYHLHEVTRLKAEIERLKVENEKMACQLEKIADFTVHPYSAAKAVLKELGRWTDPKP